MSREKPEMQQIELSQLSYGDLSKLRKQLDQEIGLYQDSMTALKLAQTKYGDSKEALEKIQPEAKDSGIMVPLTGSMFVPGRIEDTEKVLVDVGTGYFIKMNMESAKDYFKRKVAFVTEKMEEIQTLGLERSKIRDAVNAAIGIKIQAQMADWVTSKGVSS